MTACKYWVDQPDGVQGYCQHPEARSGDQCILNEGDICDLREPPTSEGLESVHTCVICGNIMSSDEYEATGCIFCGADAEPLACPESYDMRDRE
jgi:hypothetical protein